VDEQSTLGLAQDEYETRRSLYLCGSPPTPDELAELPRRETQGLAGEPQAPSGLVLKMS